MRVWSEVAELVNTLQHGTLFLQSSSHPTIMAASFSADHLVDSMPSAFLTSSDFTSPSPDFLNELAAGTINHVFVNIRQLQKQVRDQSGLLENDKSRNQ